MSLDRLIKYLEEAALLASQYQGGYSGEFLSAEEFYQALEASIHKLKCGDLTTIDDLWVWFAPTCFWDDFIGKKGLELGDKTFTLLEKIKKNPLF